MTRAGGKDIPGASPRNLWSAFSLTQLNSMLRKSLTEEEINFNQVGKECKVSLRVRTTGLGIIRRLVSGVRRLQELYLRKLTN